MAKHHFHVWVGRGKMSESDLNTRINEWIDKNTTWSDEAPYELTAVTGIDSGEPWHKMGIWFTTDDTKDNLLQKFTDKLKDKVDWYRVAYHDCDHDAGDARTPCSPDDVVEWTDKGVTIPSDVPDPTVS